MAQIVLRVALFTVLMIGGCSPQQEIATRELHATPDRLELPPAPYYGVAWIEDDVLAFAVRDVDESTRVEVFTTSADRVGSIKPAPRPECVQRAYLGLIRLPTGEIGASDVCTVDAAGPPETARLIAMNPGSEDSRDLGPTVEVPSWLAWQSDMTTAVYSVGDDLCARLFERGRQEGPLQLTVTVQGSTFEVGPDLAGDDDACPDHGRASYPAIGKDDQLAFMASASAGRLGQERLDLPWAILVREARGQPRLVLDGVRSPRGLTYLTEDRLVFSGTMGDREGIWSIRTDGTDLVRIADASASWLAAAPDGMRLVAIVEQVGVDATEVVTYDLVAAGL